MKDFRNGFFKVKKDAIELAKTWGTDIEFVYRSWRKKPIFR